MKLCFSSLGCPEKSLDQTLKTCNEYGIKYLEIRGFENELNLSLIPDFYPENLEKTKEKFSKSGVTPVSLDLSFCCHTARINDDEINSLKKDFLIAKVLNIPFVRIFGDRLESGRQDDYDDILYALKGACSIAFSFGLTVLLEVHGDFNRQETLQPILEEMKEFKNFGIIWDIGHTDLVYKENWQEFYLFAKPFIKHVHIKDHKRSPLTHLTIGDGEIPIQDILRRLNEDGFSGCISLEWERCWHRELSEIEVPLKDFITMAKNIKST